MVEDQRRTLETTLWNIADSLRGKMSPDEFRDYILGFIFYKYLSEKLAKKADFILQADDISFASLTEPTTENKAIVDAVRTDMMKELGYFLEPQALFVNMAGRENGDSIIPELEEILNDIQNSTMETSSEEDFDNLFEDMDLNSTKLGRGAEQRDSLILSVLKKLERIDFELENSNTDVLGDAYEYLIGKFAEGAGKKAGEFYTPQQVSTILSKIVANGKTHIKSVYDPTCGSGSLLLRVAKQTKVDTFYGQELNRTTFNLACMNMILHDVHFSKFNIKQEDTLSHPQHDLHLKFDAIVANPPFSAHWTASDRYLSDDRFAQYGALAPKTKADFAFVQHMLHHLSDDGTMAVVLPHGVLFRGSAERTIRQYIIKDETTNWLDAIIGLPANMFFGTSIPTCILVFKKCRKKDDSILFIDASREFDKVGNQNKLSDDHIDKIVKTYAERTEAEKYSRSVALSEIAENDYNLNIPRYIDNFEEEEAINLTKTVEEIADIDAQMVDIDAQIKAFCAELKIDSPV